jgi:XTP/dITP diphosphohydrolase
MLTLLLATENPGKIEEMEDLLEGMDIQVVTPATLGINLNVTEDGQTYAENAAKKALAHAAASQLVALGDDSGLEVDALGGAPGLRSHRFAPWESATDADRRLYLLERLKEIPHPPELPGWPARFRCTVAIAAPDGEVRYAEGVCPGLIIPEERGMTGFGYDPVFYIPEYGQTMAELGMGIKNQISHRGRALRAAIPIIREMLLDRKAPGGDTRT